MNCELALAGRTAFVTGGTGAIAVASARLLVRDGVAVLLGTACRPARALGVELREFVADAEGIH